MLITSFTSYKPLITLLSRNIEISINELGSRSFKGADFLTFLLRNLFITTRELLPKVTNFLDLARNIVKGVRELSRDKLLGLV
jgi:hypothetical protein